MLDIGGGVRGGDSGVELSISSQQLQGKLSLLYSTFYGTTADPLDCYLVMLCWYDLLDRYPRG